MEAPTRDESFRTLFEPHRRAITLHCYRMLGSIQEAEELAQEVMLRGWQRREEVRSTHSTRGWLYKIATNACLDHLLKVRRRRALPHHVVPSASTAVKLGPPSDERRWIEPVPDTLLDVEDDGQRPDQRVSERESIGLAFVTALQALSPKQRAALLLVDVLGSTPQATATLLRTTVVSVNSLLQRARKNVEGRTEERAPSEVSSADAELLRRFIATWESGDLDAFTALLADDAHLSMPPHAEWFDGREAIRAFIAAVWAGEPGPRRLLAIGANGGPAVAVYRRSSAAAAVYEASGIVLLTIRGDLVARMTRFAFPRLFSIFGLPAELPATSVKIA